MKAHLHLIKHALKDGHMISVWDGEEWQVKCSTSYKAIKDAIESVEEAQIKIRNAAGDHVGWALIIPYGMADDETVSDYGCNPYMENWAETYEQTL